MPERVPIVGLISDCEEGFRMLGHTAEVLDQFDIPHEKRAISAVLDPDGMRDYAASLDERGIRYVVVAEKGASLIAGMVKSFGGRVKVLAVVLSTEELRGFDSIASVFTLPAPIPVAIMGMDKAGAINAAIFTADSLADMHPEIAAVVREYRARLPGTVRRSTPD